VSSYAQDKSLDERGDLDETIPGGSRGYVLPVFLACEARFIDENNGTLTALPTMAMAGFTSRPLASHHRTSALTRDAIKI